MANPTNKVFTIDSIKSTSNQKVVDRLTDYQIRYSDGRKYFYLTGIKKGSDSKVVCFNSLQHKIDLNNMTDERVDSIASLVGACLLNNKAVDFSVIVGSTK